MYGEGLNPNIGYNLRTSKRYMPIISGKSILGRKIWNTYLYKSAVLQVTCKIYKLQTVYSVSERTDRYCFTYRYRMDRLRFL